MGRMFFIIIFIALTQRMQALLNICIFSIAVFGLMYTNANADIYKYVDENGTIHFTNTPIGNNYKKIISEDKASSILKDQDTSTIPSKADQLVAKDYQQVIEAKSREYNMEASLIKAVIKTESNWDTGALSSKGAMGLMQLMPTTARDMDVKNPFNPEENIEGGVKYLRYLLNKFNGDLALALAAYNAGPETVERFKGIPPIPETQRYVKRILSVYSPQANTPQPDNTGGNNLHRASTIIYKVIYNDGTVLYTNAPLLHENPKPFRQRRISPWLTRF